MNRTRAKRNVIDQPLDRFSAQFKRLGTVLKPDRRVVDREGILNPACARLPDGTLRLYPRMVAPGNVSRIGCFREHEQSRDTLRFQQVGFALEPKEAYEKRDESDGYGCEDPRVTYIPVLRCYVMAYVAFGPQGPAVAVAMSTDGRNWKRLGLMCFKKQGTRFADKDAAFFPEPVLSPKGIPSLALYHRPTLWALWRKRGVAAAEVLRNSPEHEGIAIGYVALDPVRKDLSKLCKVAETQALTLTPTAWGKVKIGGGTPPVRIREGWLAVIHGVDVLPKKGGETRLRYCAGILVHSAENLDQVLYRSPEPLFVPELPAELGAKVGDVVFPTAIDPRPDVGDRVYDIYYGMGDRATGRGRLTLNP